MKPRFIRIIDSKAFEIAVCVLIASAVVSLIRLIIQIYNT